MKSKSANRYPPELHESAVRMILGHRGEYDSEPDAIRAISSKIGCHYDTLRAWLRQHRTGDLPPIGTDDEGITTSESLVSRDPGAGHGEQDYNTHSGYGRTEVVGLRITYIYRV